ncbi:MAG: RecB-like helicase [Helicobacteraceae bacterium]|jgi:exodeoxyribonuclease V beta subunit|nr:RecB-like helicase [Helicobacteraceae bacterium]
MFQPYLACEASAGSGKTYQLSLRYVALLLMGAPCEKILCLTFTNKAANEMLDRIAKLLENLAKKGARTELNAIAAQLDCDRNELSARASKAYKEFLRADAKIMTLDSFFNQILRRFSLYCGLSPLFEIGAIDENEAIDAFLSEARKRGLIDGFLRFLLESDQNTPGGFEVFSRLYVENRTLENYENVDYKAIESAESAAMEAHKRIRDLALASGEISPSGVNALNAEHITQTLDRSWLAKSSLKEYKFFTKIFSPAMDEAFCEFKAALKNYFDLQEQNALSRLQTLYDCFAQSQSAIKKRKRLLDFADITHFARALLTGDLDKEFFYFRLDGRIEHLLIDEFQDTSPTQFEILRPIIEEFTAGSGTARLKSFFYVGDQKQSIYRFRGGAPYLFDFVASQYANITKQTLEVNYRSRRAVVEFTNQIFAPLFPDFTPQRSNRAEQGLVRVVSDDDVIGAVLQIVGELLDANVAPESIAVLVWKNGDGETIADSLRERFSDLEVVTETTQKLNRCREVRAIFEAIKYLYFNKNPLYAANLNALLGEDRDLLAELNGIDIDDAPFETCAAIADRLDLSDPNALGFLAWTATLNCAEDILYGFDALDLNASPNAQKGLRALTVHKAKGLEFEHAIVIDRLSAPRKRAERLIFDRDGAQSMPIRWRQRGREYADESYAAALERQIKDEKRDRLNSLYVALTRARDSLFVVQKTERSIFEPLNLEALELGGLDAKQAMRRAKAATEIISVRARKLGAQKFFVKNDEKPYGDLKARDFGLALHYALETTGNFNAANIDPAIEGARNLYGLYAPIDEVKKRVYSLLENATFKDLTRRAKIFKEAHLIANGETMRVDLLIDAADGWIVIDYKSGKPHSSHDEQVKKYLDALKATTGRNAKGYIAYIGEQTSLKAVTRRDFGGLRS